MLTLAYQLYFNTPAFLGNADQRAQWRAPPIKALIRQWWRVVKAPELGRNVDALRRAEVLALASALVGTPARRDAALVLRESVV